MAELGVLFIGFFLGAVFVGAVLFAYLIAPMKKLLVIRSLVSLVASSLDEINGGVSKAIGGVMVVVHGAAALLRLGKTGKRILRILRRR